MVEVREVITKKQVNEFVTFPSKLYKGCPYFVPMILADEKNIFNPKKNAAGEDCEYKFFLAYKDGKIAGRIGGIIQKLYIDKTGEKRVRFTRFHCINDQEVANALFKTVEDWAISKGMTLIHGPLGFNDLEREGLLVEGFDQLGTYEEEYNYDYYQTLIENYGFKKEVDWIEYQIFTPKEINERFKKLSDAVLKRYKLQRITMQNKKKFLKKYMNGIFEIIDAAYAPLYGVVPYSQKVRVGLVKQFNMVLDKRFIVLIVDENDKPIAFAFAMPSMSKSMQKCGGKLFPFGFINVLKEIKKADVIDFALIGVLPEYINKGITAIILNGLVETMIEQKVQHAETNLMLEENEKIQETWKDFDHIQNKRRRSYIKQIKQV